MNISQAKEDILNRMGSSLADEMVHFARAYKFLCQAEQIEVSTSYQIKISDREIAAFDESDNVEIG